MRSEFESVSDQELARQSQAGSMVAFEELVRRYERRVYSFVNGRWSNDEDAREITQDTFVQAFRAIDQFDCERPFSPWLFTIASRKTHDRYRFGGPKFEEVSPDLPDTDNPADNLGRREDRDLLWNCARRRLPRDQFEALWLRYSEELNVSEIASVLGLTQTHVKVLLFRARRTLSHHLKSSPKPTTQRSDALKRTAFHSPQPSAQAP